MLQGTILKSFYNAGYTYKVDWTATQNIANNTSTIEWIAYIVSKAGYGMQTSSRNGTITIDGKTTTFLCTLNFKGNTTTELARGKTTLNHEESGSKTFNISATLRVDILGLGTQTIIPVNYALDPIPRTSKITMFEDFTPEKELLVMAPLKHGSFKNKFEIKLGSTTIASKSDMGSSATFTVAELQSIYPYMYTAFSMKAVLVVTTYNEEGIYIGVDSLVKTVSLPIDIATSTIKDYGIKDLKGTGKLLQGYSEIEIFLNVNLGLGAKAHQSKIYIDEVLVSNTSSYVFISSEARKHNYKIEFEDTRGTDLVVEGSFFVEEYLKPSIGNIEHYRCDENGERFEDGELYLIKFGYKSFEGNSIINIFNGEENIYSENKSNKEGVFEMMFSNFKNIGENYELRIVVGDGLGESVYNFIIPEASVSLDFNEDLKSISFFDYAKEAETHFFPGSYKDKHGKVLSVIVEKITENESYIVFSNGLCILRMTDTRSISIGVTYGTVFVSGSQAINYPFEFLTVPDVSIGQGRWTTGASIASISAITNKSVSVNIVDFAKRAIGVTRISFTAIGYVDINKF